jgi:hypothetical protein
VVGEAAGGAAPTSGHAARYRGGSAAARMQLPSPFRFLVR